MRWMLWMAVGISGCASHAVKCDLHLQAINSPAPQHAEVAFAGQDGTAKSAVAAASSRRAP